jgi:serine palmitoyltransferase
MIDRDLRIGDNVANEQWQCLANGVLITRLKAFPLGLGVNPRDAGWQPTPALKVCVTSGLTKKETEKAGITIRHAITKVISKRR